MLGEGRGAHRWLDLGVVRFQPSELLKLTMPMMVAWYLNGRPLPPGWITLAAVGVLIVIPVGLIAEQPDLGTALLIAASGAFGVFLSGLAWWRIGLLLGAFAAAVPVGWHFLHDYQKNRVLTLLDPEADPLGNGWHIIQSQIAVGSGGLWGKGWHHGTQSRLEFLPEHTTDFIFSVFAEEWGLLGVLMLLALYAFIIARCLWIAANAKDTYSRLLSGAISMALFVYVIVNGGMITGLAAGRRRAAAAGELRRHVGGVAACRVRRADVDPCAQEARDLELFVRVRSSVDRTRQRAAHAPSLFLSAALHPPARRLVPRSRDDPRRKPCTRSTS